MSGADSARAKRVFMSPPVLTRCRGAGTESGDASNNPCGVCVFECHFPGERAHSFGAHGDAVKDCATWACRGETVRTGLSGARPAASQRAASKGGPLVVLPY